MAPSSIDGRDFQVAFGRILTEPDLNHRFIAEPRAVGAELGLADEQIEALCSAGLERLHSFHHAQTSKRVGLIHKIVPATAALLEQRGLLQRYGARFVAEYPPVESDEYPSRSIRDGFWLLQMIVGLGESGELDDPLLAQVAQFELAVLHVSSLEASVESAVEFSEAGQALPQLERSELLGLRPRQGTHARVETFPCAILDIVRGLAEGRDVSEPTPTESIVLISKLPGWRNVRYAQINRQTRSLLESCDGLATTREIIARLLREHHDAPAPESFAEQCLALLRQLAEINVLTFDPA